ncbi:hypothetical protein DL240_00705 [Lujinxingia litoralis]|uniref:ABC transporter permease n=1 Tax=Lujinxingia litoralis TaxID=2211119 RepID=A0A328CDK1_9DELT|nr:ABC transporter permease [Lujinxingia litoralis]RAL24763.1 hypothetical protein DL240_00705 [Lujinxingia litoralis]
MTSTSLPARNLGVIPQALRLFSLDFGRQLRARKTLVLLAVQLLPVLVALAYVAFGQLDGMTMFRNSMESVYLPFLVPLAALYFGGPAIVDEIEGRTITYLTLRPLPRALIYLAKLKSAMLSALLVTSLPIILLFGICAFSSGELLGELPTLGKMLGASAVGVLTYTAVFAMLAAIFSSSLLLGIVYYVIVEMVIAAIPVLELVSIKFHVRTIAGLQGADRAGWLDRLILDEPLNFEWWFGLLVAAIFTTLATAVATAIFREKQFHV